MCPVSPVSTPSAAVPVILPEFKNSPNGVSPQQADQPDEEQTPAGGNTNAKNSHKEGDPYGFWQSYNPLESVIRLTSLVAGSLIAVYSNLDKQVGELVEGTPPAKWTSEKIENLLKTVLPDELEDVWRSFDPQSRQKVLTTLLKSDIDGWQDLLSHSGVRIDLKDVLQKAQAGEMTEDQVLESVARPLGYDDETLDAVKAQMSTLGGRLDPDKLKIIASNYLDGTPGKPFLGPLVEQIHSNVPVPGFSLPETARYFAGQKTVQDLRKELRKIAGRGGNKLLVAVLAITGLNIAGEQMLEKLNPGQKPEEEASASARSGKEPEKQEFEKVTGGPLDWLEMLVMMAGGAYGARHFAGKHLKLKGAWAKNMSMAAGALGGFAVSELLLHSVDWLYNKIADHFGYDKDSNQAFGKSAIETVIAIVLSAVVHAKGSAVKLFKIANARNNLGFTLSSNALIRFLAEIPQQIATIFRIGAGLEPNATPLGKLVDMTGRPTENLAKLQHEVENVILADLRDKSPGAWHLSNFATRIAGRAFLDAPSLTRTLENHPTHDPGWHQKLPAMAWDMITKNAAFNLISIPTTLLAFPFLYVTNLISGAFGSLGFGGGDEGEGDGAAEATAA